MKKLIVAIVVIAALVASYFIFFQKKEESSNGYKTTPIEKGDIVNTVSSTGELEPVSTVDIGTQVSGNLDKVLVDFNSQVKKGQLLAVIDTFNLAAQLRDAQASLEKAEASAEIAHIEYDNQKRLLEKDMASQYTLDKARTTLRSAEASLAQAQESILRAKRNLSYAIIRSPIDGIVINRAVEPGQTVAASFSAPVLFTIAENLDKMRILASVDESDIGLIDTGMAATFEVPAYPEQTFTGKVTQIRMQPTVVSNVVNYTVVIEADNPGDVLMPGMTATVDFLLDEKRDVLMVANTALTFQPGAELMQTFRKKMQSLRQNGDSSRQRPQDGQAGGPGGPGDSLGSPADSIGSPPESIGSPADSIGRPQDIPDSLRAKMDSLRAVRQKSGDSSTQTQQGSGFGFGGQRSDNVAMLWFFDENHEISAVPVKKGATDGKNTEITPLRGELPVGTEIIIKAPEAGNGDTTPRNNNPFAPGRPGR